MKNKIFTITILTACLLMSSQLMPAQLPKETESQKTQRMKWWTDARFGMFIHWGLCGVHCLPVMNG
jgi:alpha-L-fucosidase